MPVRSTNDVIRFLGDTVRRSESGAIPPGYGVFALAYHAFSLELLSRVTAGGFADPPWVSDFMVRFCARYEQALSTPSASVSPWRLAFDNAARDPKPVLRHMLLGINAHMSYDLCAVLVDMLTGSPPAPREADVRQINQVIDGGIDRVQRAIGTRYGTYTGWLDFVGLGLDELATWKTFVEWRQDAWDDALEVLSGASSLADVERRVTYKGHAISWLAL